MQASAGALEPAPSSAARDFISSGCCCCCWPSRWGPALPPRRACPTSPRCSRPGATVSAGGLLEAQTIEYGAPRGGGGGPIGVGFGIGSFGRVGGGVSTGVDVSTGTTVGGSSSGNATAIDSFPLAQAGPRPWRVRVTLEGVEPADILVGEP